MSLEATKIPDGLEHWTADEVAECISYEKHLPENSDLYSKLWGFLNKAKNPTPIGGDGSNGTVEYPIERCDPENDDKAPHWWNCLTEEEKHAITLAWEEENN